MNDDLKHIERGIRAWTARPPSRPPGAERTRILARLGERGARPRWRLAAAAAASALALVAGLLLFGPRAPQVPANSFITGVAQEDRNPGSLFGNGSSRKVQWVYVFMQIGLVRGRASLPGV